MAAFVDTNILLYALCSVNEEQFDKVAIAKDLVENLARRNRLVLSAQVLSEFISVAGRKGKRPLTTAETADIVARLSKQIVIPVDVSLVRLALERKEKSGISYWDALIVEAAIRSGATTLYTEDMHHGTRYGVLQLVNPFVS
jgi:predicted nucleic acid-binding protein